MSKSVCLQMDQHLLQTSAERFHPASCVDHFGASALTTAGLMQLGGAFLSSSCGPSYSGDVLLLLFADDMLLAKISLNLSMYFICASSDCK